MSAKLEYAIMGATAREVSHILSLLETPKRRRLGFLDATLGKLSGNEVVVSVCGLGIASAALAGAVLLENFEVNTIVCVGIAGGYRRGNLKRGDVVIVEEEVYADMGIDYGNFTDALDEIGIPVFQRGKHRFFNRWPVNSSLVEIAKTKADALTSRYGFSIHFGRALTVCAVSGSTARAGKLEKLYSPLCESMEGAALAQVAVAFGVEFFECRGISNRAGVRDKKKWKIREASKNAQVALVELVSPRE